MNNNLAEKMQKAISSKNAIKQAILNKGVDVGDVFDEYASAIDEIETGITPSGTLEITENGEKDVTQYASVNVNVESSGGISGFEEMTGTAGEDLKANDVVGYFNSSYPVEKLTSRNYFDEGRKYYVINSPTLSIYKTEDDSLIEQRTTPNSASIICNNQSPTIDYCYLRNTGTKIITIYKYNENEYEQVVEFTSNASLYLTKPTENKDYIIFLVGDTVSANGIGIICINKTSYTFEQKQVSMNYYVSDGAIICNYNGNVCYFATTYNYGTKYPFYIQKTILPNISSITTIISNTGATSTNVLRNLIANYYCYAYIYGTNLYVYNEYENTRTFVVTTTTKFVNASEDFNEILTYDTSTKTFKLYNVIDNTSIEVTENLPTYYIYNLTSCLENGSILTIYDLETNEKKNAKVLGVEKQFNKLTTFKTSSCDYIGIVKEDVSKGETATVYKII